MRLPIVIVLLFLAPAGNAQFMPVQSTIKTPYGNVSHTTHHYSQMYNFGTATRSAKYLFTITLRNDSVITKRAWIDISSEKHAVVFREKGKKKILTPSETKQISRATYTKGLLVGTATDTTWLFKSVTGRINGYASTPEIEMMWVVAVQEGEGPIVPLTRTNLLPMVASDPKAVHLTGKGKLWKALEVFNKTSE